MHGFLPAVLPVENKGCKNAAQGILHHVLVRVPYISLGAEECLAGIAAVNLGGDADTIGAACGQIAGAYYGHSAIPRKWLEAVKDWQTADALIDKFLDMVL